MCGASNWYVVAKVEDVDYRDKALFLDTPDELGKGTLLFIKEETGGYEGVYKVVETYDITWQRHGTCLRVKKVDISKNQQEVNYYNFRAATVAEAS